MGKEMMINSIDKNDILLTAKEISKKETLDTIKEHVDISHARMIRYIIDGDFSEALQFKRKWKVWDLALTLKKSELLKKKGV